MRRFGHDAGVQASEMGESHLFRMGLQLLIIMVKARLEGYPLGEFRKSAVTKTASRVHKAVSSIESPLARTSVHHHNQSDAHLFRERVKLLCVMATAMVSEAYPLGRHRRDAVLDNIDSISSLLFPGQDFSVYRSVLKAA